MSGPVTGSPISKEVALFLPSTSPIALLALNNSTQVNGISTSFGHPLLSEIKQSQEYSLVSHQNQTYISFSSPGLDNTPFPTGIGSLEHNNNLNSIYSPKLILNGDPLSPKIITTPNSFSPEFSFPHATINGFGSDTWGQSMDSELENGNFFPETPIQSGRRLNNNYNHNMIYGSNHHQQQQQQQNHQQQQQQQNHQQQLQQNHLNNSNNNNNTRIKNRTKNSSTGRRPRNSFTEVQRDLLLEFFSNKSHTPSRDQKNDLAHILGTSFRTITVWFQNQRQKYARCTRVDDPHSIMSSPLVSDKSKIIDVISPKKISAAANNKSSTTTINNKQLPPFLMENSCSPFISTKEAGIQDLYNNYSPTNLMNDEIGDDDGSISGMVDTISSYNNLNLSPPQIYTKFRNSAASCISFNKSPQYLDNGGSISPQPHNLSSARQYLSYAQDTNDQSLNNLYNIQHNNNLNIYQNNNNNSDSPYYRKNNQYSSKYNYQKNYHQFLEYNNKSALNNNGSLELNGSKSNLFNNDDSIRIRDRSFSMGTQSMNNNNHIPSTVITTSNGYREIPPFGAIEITDICDTDQVNDDYHSENNHQWGDIRHQPNNNNISRHNSNFNGEQTSSSQASDYLYNNMLSNHQNRKSRNGGVTNSLSYNQQHSRNSNAIQNESIPSTTT